MAREKSLVRSRIGLHATQLQLPTRSSMQQGAASQMGSPYHRFLKKADGRKGAENIMPDNGLVERFNGRVQREVLGIAIYSHRDPETLLRGFNQAYNRRRKRVLKGASPEQVVQRRLAAEPKLASRRFKPPDSDALPASPPSRRSRQGGLASRPLVYQNRDELRSAQTGRSSSLQGVRQLLSSMSPTKHRFCFRVNSSSVRSRSADFRLPMRDNRGPDCRQTAHPRPIGEPSRLRP
jgi:hypothetical protein